MLYKKYHRSYISQFKEGIKFRWTGKKLSVDTVMIEPYATDYSEIRMCGSKYSYECSWILVYRDGMIEQSIKVI